jgi:hypothetical protein
MRYAATGRLTFTILSPINIGISVVSKHNVDLVVQSRDEYEQMDFFEYGECDAQCFCDSSGNLDVRGHSRLGAKRASPWGRADGCTGGRANFGIPGDQMR